MKASKEFVPTAINMIFLILMIYQIQHIPKEIKQGIDGSVDESVLKLYKTIKAATPPPPQRLEHKGNFYYCEGYTKGKSGRISDNFSEGYDYPIEIWNGYLTRLIDKDGGLHLVWSRDKIKEKTIINGWFVTDNISSFETEAGYRQVLYPIAERDKINLK